MPRIPPLVGKAEAAGILGCHPNNMKRDVPDLPEPLQDRIEGMAVKATPLWTKGEIERIAARRARQRAEAVKVAYKKLAASK